MFENPAPSYNEEKRYAIESTNGMSRSFNRGSKLISNVRNLLSNVKCLLIKI